jgi:hypothetical protein
MSLFAKISEYWHKKGWFLILIGVAAFFVFYYLFFARKNESGTYSKGETFHIPPSVSNKKTYKFGGKSESRAPRESKGERRCREVLQKVFNKPFPNCRPDFMFNGVTGENLELDMFDYDMKLAVEYNGQQHYKYTPFMHGNTKEKFYAQQYRDRMKKDACKKLKINLIEVPYTVKEAQIEDFLIKELRILGYKC